MADDPWENITAPTSRDTVFAHRVDVEIPWNFYWARATDRKCLLVLRYQAASAPDVELPTLKGMELGLTTGESENHLVFRLIDSAQRDIFHRLCLDIVASTANAADEKEAVSQAVKRTWRWHHLLRGGRDSRLSEEEQKGLVGELLLLETLLLPRFSAVDAMHFWTGPLDAPKDFDVAGVAIEVKARRGTARPFISISSEHQLDQSGTEMLILSVVDLAPAPAESEGSFTLTDLADRISAAMASENRTASDLFESRLLAAGFLWSHSYAEFNWVAGRHSLYRVEGEFPRITGSALPNGVTSVRYALSLADCEPYKVDVEFLDKLLAEVQNGRGA